MQISFFQNFNIRNNQNYPRSYQGITSPNLAPLAHDTVTFGALKKSAFSGLNRAIIEKFKAPIEKFNTEADFQNWARTQVEDIATKDFSGRQPETIEQRKAIIKEWYDYVTKENDAYTPAIALLALRSITAGLKADEDTIPPALNKGVLAETVDNLQKELKIDEKKNSLILLKCIKQNFNQCIYKTIMQIYKVIQAG